MIADEIYTHVLPAVRLALADLNGHEPADSAQLVQTRLWPYITHAVHELQIATTTAAAPAPEKVDGRSKAWQIVAHFWQMTALGPEKVAESDPEIIIGTGKIAEILNGFSEDLHEVMPAELGHENVKKLLPQLRNNLGRYGKAVLRIEYTADEEQFLCQVDVTKP